ncbi:hypothetical protein NKJ59_20100 [Mesorhizobium australicum]|uniref:hypothetical protein n=1 Tax=Mesorhizobium australicum TaxID=536018 RepID=UPI00333B04E8
MNILPQDRQVAVISALIEGCSIRATERMTDTRRDTVMRLGARIGRGCAALHDMMFRDLNINQLQFDELWAYIGKKQKRVKRDDDPTKGDCYTFLALDPLDKAIVSYRVGKRTGETTLDFVKDVRARVLGMPFITSDAFPAYEPSIRAVFGPGVHYTQIVKTYVNEPPVNAAPLLSRCHRKGSQGTCIRRDAGIHGFNQPCRARQPFGPYGLASVHAVDEWLQ